jgi:rhodanese-related sulfurtransferase
MKKIYRLAVSIQCVLVLFSCSAQTPQLLTVADFEKEINKDSVQLLDVRTPGEYANGHLKNTLLANWNDAKEFDRRIAFVDKNKPVYVYCLSGGRSAAAAEKMRKEGYLQVYELDGGINAWKAAEKPLVGKNNAPAMTIEAFNAAIQSSATVLVDFGAEWCPPCKKMEPILKSLQAHQAEKYTLLKVDGGHDDAILKQYHITALPVFILFKNGKQVWRRDGTATEEEIAAIL